MRLLNTTTYQLHDSGEAVVLSNPQYAILSHRWQPPEISYQTLNPAELQDASLRTPQLDKIRGACAKARARDPPLDWLWIDSCCIDKANAVEETRSINSMFAWYRKAAVCITFLYDVDECAPREHMFESQDPRRAGQKSEWFERGWTLQELLAPREMEFYGWDWKLIGTKKELSSILESLTGIDKRYLSGDVDFRTASLATRMSWMAGRVTTQVEDIAYSLIGILDVNMPPIYGEGVKAFMRLQRTLLENSSDESIFAWTVPAGGLKCYQSLGETPSWNPSSWGLLAPSPDCFKKFNDLVIIPKMVVPRLQGGYRWAQQAVSTQMPGKPGAEMVNALGILRSEVTLTLNCWRHGRDGKPNAIQLQLVKRGDKYERVQCHELGQKRGGKPGTNKVMGAEQLVFKTLTVVQPALDVIV